MKLTCPTKNRLREFLEGSVADADADQLSDHVEDCQTCDLVLSTLESEQSDLLKELREGIRTESLLQEPEFEKLRNTARFSQADTTASADVDEHPQTGKRLRDYRLVKKIGEGGMGTVYQAFHVHLAKHVALKILPSDKLRSKQSVARFRQEMRAVGQVNHPNVVSASDAGTIDGQHFLVMELVQGADLARIIHDRGPLKVADACEIVRQAAIGLQHAHDNGLVHRDVKPSNIMLALDGSVKLLDLGLAGLNNSEFESTANVVVTDRLTSVGQIMGTLDYMAPEQITASPEVDGRADIYALGATLFQLLTGRTPCGDRSEETPQRIEAVLHKPPLDIRALRNDVPEELCTLLLKMLAKKPEDRPVAAIDVASELTRFASDADLDALAEECRTSLDMPSADVDVTDDVSFVVSRGKHPQDKGNSKRTFTAVGLAGCFLALVAAIVYYIQTNNGTVRVEVLDEALQVTIDGQAVTMKERNKQPIKLRPGPHKLVVSQGETEFLTDNFEIRRNDKLAFKVDLFPGEVVLSMEGRGHKSKTLRGAVPLHLNTELSSLKQTEKARKGIEMFSATALVNGCEVTGDFTAEQAEIAVKNPTREAKDVTFYYQIVYQDSRERGDIFVIAGGKFESELPPGRSELKRVDILPDPNRGAPLGHVKDMLAIRVSQERPGYKDIPIVPGKKLDIAKQPITIATQATPGYSAAARPLEKLQDRLGPEFPARISPIKGKEKSDSKTTREETAATQIKLLEQALDLYKLKNGAYPSTKEGLEALVEQPADENLAKNWSGYFLANEKLALDPWGNAFSYEFPGTRGGDRSKPNIWSLGPDGKFNTDDDVNNWDNKPAQEDLKSEPKPRDGDGVGVTPLKPATGPYVKIDNGYMVPYRETIPGSDVTFEMVPVPGGVYRLIPQDDSTDPTYPIPIEVNIDPFWIGRYEVTWAEYHQYCAMLDAFKRFERLGIRKVTSENQKDAVTIPSVLYDAALYYPAVADKTDWPKHPATAMTQYAARQYTKWLSKLTGEFYRLPSDVEWEYACRAGSTTLYSFGDEAEQLGNHAWYKHNSDQDTHPVGLKKPNKWGIYDLHGNVSEWVLDQFSEKYVGLRMAIAADRQPVHWPTRPHALTVRGGSWDSLPEDCRSVARVGSTVAWQELDFQLPPDPHWLASDIQRKIGFRIARPLNLPPAESQGKYWNANVRKLREAVSEYTSNGYSCWGLVDPDLPSAIHQLDN